MTHAVPEGDILVHSGDLTNVGEMREIIEVGNWFRELSTRFQFIVYCAGNHYWMFQRNRSMALELMNLDPEKVIYLEDSATTVMGLKVYGSPVQPTFFDWAFNVDRGPAIKRYWDLIPEDLDVLITHGPPMGIGDQSVPWIGSKHLGCEELMAAVERTKPKIHAFGHIHGGRGQTKYENTLFLNAAICNEAYSPVNPPIVIEV
jgi:Icc-related predicted phosphoesterase